MVHPLLSMKFLTIFFAFAAPLCAATLCVSVSSTGAGTGADWSNTLGQSFTPVRGNTYYVADGSYSAKTWSVANSSTTAITIKKATVADHFTATGWSDAMGDGQAIWAKWIVTTDYWVFDGAGRDANWRTGAVAKYGIKVTGGGANGHALTLGNGSGTGCDNSTFRYIDFVGGGQGTGDGDDVIYGLDASANLTFQYCALRDSDRTIFLMRGEWQSLLVEDSYLARNNSTPAIHGEMLSDVGSDFVTFRNNVIEDIEGTAVWAVLNGTGTKTTANTAAGWDLYGNEIRWTGSGEAVAALVYVANDGSNKNWMDDRAFVNNTVVNAPSGTFYIIYQDVAGTGNSATNNIFYSCAGGVWSNAGTLSYNWYYNTTNTSDSGTGKTSLTSGGSAYFTAVPSDMSLALPIAGTSLASKYNTDPNGIIRGADATWDRGAFEKAAGAGTPAQDRLLRPAANVTIGFR